MKQIIQEFTRPHIESYNNFLTDGLKKCASVITFIYIQTRLENPGLIL